MYYRADDPDSAWVIAGLTEKLLVLLVCHLKLINIEDINEDSALWTFIVKSGNISEWENFFIVFNFCVTGPHEKLASRDINHHSVIFRSSDSFNREGANKRGLYWIVAGKHEQGKAQECKQDTGCAKSHL